jgi:hypothetical protein
LKREERSELYKKWLIGMGGQGWTLSLGLKFKMRVRSVAKMKLRGSRWKRSFKIWRKKNSKLMFTKGSLTPI